MTRTRIRAIGAALLLTSVVGLQPAPALAQGRDRWDRWEDQRDRREDKRDRREDRWDRREDRYDRREDRYDRREDRYDRYDARDSWDAARYYRKDDRRYRAVRLGRNDRIYRGSDNRYYCKRSDGTAGLIIGGISGGVLGSVIAPRGHKTVGAIIGGGLGAVLGKMANDDEIVCR